MSKKSRRRNKKILGALLLGGLGLAAANRKPKQSSVSVDSGRGSGLRPTVDDTEFKETVYQDDIMKGGKGVKYQKPDLRFGQVINKKGNVQTIKPFKSAGLTLGVGKKPLKLKDNSIRAKNRKVDIFGNKEPNKPMIATLFPKSNTADNYAADMRDFGRTMQYKKGGRVKGCGVAKKGFGRAMKKGRK